MPLDITTTTYGDLTLVGIAGAIGPQAAPRLSERLESLLTTRPQAVLLDLGLVTKLSQAGVGVLVRTAVRCKLQGCVLALCRVPDHVRSVLVEERVDIPAYDTLADATETLLYAAAWR
ncbi:MAG TPA: STAS domain-containing protein [Frankiaceae bacterium]|nr:STAS domain-containing protein [Frankiaceae bacterium]